MTRLVFARVGLALAAVFVSPTDAVAIPVFDAANVAQATISAIEDVNQTAQMILTYKNQLEQYELMLRDAAAPAVYVWDKTNETIDNVKAVGNALRRYKGLSYDIHESLAKFGDLDYYRASPCYSKSAVAGSCGALLKAYRERQRKNSADQKRANDALFETLDNQQAKLDERAKRMDTLQRNAQTAKGQLEATQYANQLLSAQNTELMELRTLLLAQQNIAATQNQGAIDRSAEEAAAAEALRRGEFERSQPRSW